MHSLYVFNVGRFFGISDLSKQVSLFLLHVIIKIAENLPMHAHDLFRSEYSRRDILSIRS